MAALKTKPSRCADFLGLLSQLQESNARLEQTTKELQEEKLRLDALLVRQYNLLQVLGGPNGKGKAKDKHNDEDDANGVMRETGSMDSSAGSREGLTLGRTTGWETS
jgi:hypothetical protein